VDAGSWLPQPTSTPEARASTTRPARSVMA
jgi:hypothetical protein